MKRFAFVCLSSMFALSAFGQRVFVSGNGNDINPCSVSQPCRTIQQALAVVTAGGDIVVLDSAGYGSTVSINKSVNIISPDGIYGVISGGFVINATTADIIRIKGIDIIGTSTASGTGVDIGFCKRTELERMRISHIGTGIRISQDIHAVINNLIITDTSTGIYCIGTQTAAGPGQSSPPLKVLVQNTIIDGAATGVNLLAGSFWMTNNSIITNTTVDEYMIAAIVPNCSSISNAAQVYNTHTGVFNMNCMCNLEDLRNGMNFLGNCNY